MESAAVRKPSLRRGSEFQDHSDPAADSNAPDRVAPALEERDLQAALDRVLQSETFRASGSLRRLLAFLGDKLLAGEADQLKEYSIGIDCLGKSTEYDPRQDPGVRIQTGRLREKLAAYYRDEGKRDSVVIDLPKGHFKLSFSQLAGIEDPLPAMSTAPHSETPFLLRRERLLIAMALALLVTTLWAGYASVRLVRERSDRTQRSDAVAWAPALGEFWRSFLAGRKPIIVVYEDFPFTAYRGTGKYADRTFFFGSEEFVKEQDLNDLPEINAFSAGMHNPRRIRNRSFVPIGQLRALFLAANLLWTHAPGISFAETSNLTWQQLADYNVLYIGDPKFFAPRLAALPVNLSLRQTNEGIRNLAVAPGEPAEMMDQIPAGLDYDGEVYGLVTRAPGPMGTTDVISFTCNRSPGCVAAVQWFMDEKYAEGTLSYLKKGTGRVPRYYQAVLKVRFRDGIPVQTELILVHPLKLRPDS